MPYELSSLSFNLLKEESWERILKFTVVNIAVGVVVALLLAVAVYLLSSTSIKLTVVVIIGVLLMSQAFLLSWYEQWRGCYFNTSASTGES